MYCELMAEHRRGTQGPVSVARWHVVRQDQHAALCGRVLARDCETLSIADPHAHGAGEVCPACWTRYQALP